MQGVGGWDMGGGVGGLEEGGRGGRRLPDLVL